MREVVRGLGGVAGDMGVWWRMWLGLREVGSGCCGAAWVVVAEHDMVLSFAEEDRTQLG